MSARTVSFSVVHHARVTRIRNVNETRNTIKGTNLQENVVPLELYAWFANDKEYTGTRQVKCDRQPLECNNIEYDRQNRPNIP